MSSDESDVMDYTHLDYDMDELVDRAMSIMEGMGIFSGKGNRYIQCSRADFRIHFRYVTEAIQVGSQSIFSDYVDWNMVFFKGLGMEDIIKPTFEIMLQVMDEIGMGERAREIMSPGLSKLGHIQSEVEITFEDTTLGRIAESYCEKLLAMDREGAWSMIDENLQQGVRLIDLYEGVFVPSLRNVGLLWQTGRITVAQEHLFTTSTQTIMARLYPRVFASSSEKGRVLAACVSGELHEMGIRMIADILELEGYDTSYLGANTPSDAILDMLKETGAKTILLSATMTYHIERLRRLVDMIKEDPQTKDVKVLVGGRPFLVDPQLWKKIGADGYTRDIREAVEAVSNTGVN